MNEVFIDIRRTDLEELFPNKDLITVEELYILAVEQSVKIEELKEKIKMLNNEE